MLANWSIVKSNGRTPHHVTGADAPSRLAGRGGAGGRQPEKRALLAIAL
jgi:hypothetical protein